MKKISIYTFWIGDNKKRKELENNVKQFNKNSKYFEKILGPTQDEHNFLMKNNDLYNQYFNEKKYAFLSDIYRFWISSKKSNIIYMDSTVEFKEGALYQLFLDCKKNNKNCFVFESYRIIWSGFFISINAINFFHKCYVDISNNIFLSSPLTMTKHLKKDKKIKTYKSFDETFSYFYDINFLNFNSNDFEIIKINPTASWRKKDSYNIWIKKVKKFKLTNLRDLIFLNLPFFLQKIIFNLIN